MTTAEIVKLYVAVNGKAPTATELSAVESSQDQVATINAMEATSTVATTAGDTTAFLNAAYQSAFGRVADAEGLSYWGNLIDTGVVSKSNFMDGLLTGADNYVANATYPDNAALATKDVAITTNKTEVATNFAASGITDAAFAEKVIQAVSSDASTLTIVNDLIDMGKGSAGALAEASQTLVEVKSLIDANASDDTAAAAVLANVKTLVASVAAKVADGTITSIAATLIAITSTVKAAVTDATYVSNASALADDIAADPVSATSTATAVTDPSTNSSAATAPSTSNTANTVSTIAATHISNGSTVNNLVITDAVSVADLTTIDGLTTGTVTAATVTDLAANITGQNLSAYSVTAINATAATAATTISATSAAVNVTGLTDALTATAVTGALSVTAAADAAMSVATGSGTNTIVATALTDGQVLTLTGSSAASVSFANGDVTANTYTGALTVTGTGTTGQFTTGTVSSSISSTGATTIVATALADGQTLTTSGAGATTITGLQADLTDTSTAAQNITVVDVATITLALGSDTTGTEAITATALLNGNVLTMTGANDATVAFANGDVTATAYTGALTVTGTGTTGQFTTGTVSSSISSTGATTVVATALADGQTLSTSGAGATTITGLQADLTDTSTAAQTITVVAVPTITLALGTDVTGAESITATALTDGQVLTMTGSNDATVSLVAGDLSAAAYAGALTVTATTGTNVITTGSGANDITGGAGIDTINISASSGAVDTLRYASTDSSTSTSDQITGFTANSDILDLAGAFAKRAAADVDGVDSGTILSDRVDANGLITFDDANTFAAAVVINAANLADAIGYLVANVTTNGETVMFQYDASANGSYGAGDAMLVFQAGATTDDTLITLVGVDATAITTLAAVAGVATVAII